MFRNKASPKDYSPRYTMWLLQDAIWLHWRGEKAEAMQLLFEVIENQCPEEVRDEQTTTGQNPHSGAGKEGDRG